ncbi:MAG: rod-binding protein [Pseudomonadota bacterium]
MVQITPGLPVPNAATPKSEPDFDHLRELAVEFEASFLAEMLKAAGLGETKGDFTGGTGEAQFASFLRMEQARGMAQSGGIGLAEQVFQSLKEHYDE